VLRISKRPEPVHNCPLSLVHLARTIELQSITPSYSKKHLEGQPRVRGRTQNTDTRITTQLVSLALITSHLKNKDGKEESTIAKAKRQERQITHGSLSLSLKSLITNDRLSQLWNLERLEALIVSWNGLLALVLNVEDWNAWMK
jgi:hypothetical protein